MSHTRFLLRVSLLLAAIAFFPGARAATTSFDAGEAAYTSGDFDTAARHFRPLADQGHVLAQYNLGLLYEEGQGVSQDFGKAREWYRRAALQGNVDACFALGQMSARGVGEARDLVQAHFWFELANRAPHSHRLAAEARSKVAKQMSPAEIEAARKLLQGWSAPSSGVLTGALQP
jgi:hypothetical protein